MEIRIQRDRSATFLNLVVTVNITLPENISQYKLDAIIEKLTGEDFTA